MIFSKLLIINIIFIQTIYFTNINLFKIYIISILTNKKVDLQILNFFA